MFVKNSNLFFSLSIIAVSSADVEDVREVLQYYRQFENPLAKFKENQRLLLQQLQEKELEEKNAAPVPIKRWSPSFLGRK